MQLRTASASTDLDVRIGGRRLLGALVLAIVALNLANAASIALGADTRATRYFLLAQEGNPSTWLAAVALALTGGAAWLVGHGRVDGRMWSTVAGVLVVMSLDEVAAFHERLGGVPVIPGIGTRGWAGAGALIAGIVGMKLFRWVFGLEPPLRRALLAGGAVFLAGALGVEVIAGDWEAARGRDAGFWLVSSIEENLELLGVLVVLRALLDHLAARPQALAVRVTR